MTEATYNWLVWGWIIFGAIVFIILLFVSAPYGRHSRKGWGPMIPNKLGWVAMELPSMIFFAWFFLRGNSHPEPVTWIFFAAWVGHYINRSLIFPFRTRTKGKQMPALIALMAIFFNFVNGSINGLYFSKFSPEYTIEWLSDSRFILGSALFVVGMLINITADEYLLSLRKNSNGTYQIPRGKLFKYVSCPNFMGEIIEWTGFAIMVWSPAGLAFALWTFFNLVPRAMEHHKWYKKTFPDYPNERKAVIPFVI